MSCPSPLSTLFAGVCRAQPNSMLRVPFNNAMHALSQSWLYIAAEVCSGLASILSRASFCITMESRCSICSNHMIIMKQRCKLQHHAWTLVPTAVKVSKMIASLHIMHELCAGCRLHCILLSSLPSRAIIAVTVKACFTAGQQGNKTAYLQRNHLNYQFTVSCLCMIACIVFWSPAAMLHLL